MRYQNGQNGSWSKKKQSLIVFISLAHRSFQVSLRNLYISYRTTFWLVNSFSPRRAPWSPISQHRGRMRREVWRETQHLKSVMAAASVVKKDGIRKRSFPQSSTKHMLSTPYHLQW